MKAVQLFETHKTAQHHTTVTIQISHSQTQLLNTRYSASIVLVAGL